MRAVLIPLKDPSRAKTRLAGMLTAAQRSGLVWAMFEDVTAAVASARVPDIVTVVTSFGPAAELARAKGWDVLIEKSQSSESESVDWASRMLARRGCDLVMRLPGDIPLVRARDIDELLSIEIAAPGSLLVPSRDGTGTNAIIRTPPDLFPSHFGKNSRVLHREEAERIAARFVEVACERIALDIDEPGDLKALMAAGNGTRTHEFLTQLGTTSSPSQ